MSANLGLVLNGRSPVLGLAGGRMIAKFALMYAIARIGGAPNERAATRRFGSQGGEFAFILFGRCRSRAFSRRAPRQLSWWFVDHSMLRRAARIRSARARSRALDRTPRGPEFDTIAGPATGPSSPATGAWRQIVSSICACARAVHGARGELSAGGFS